MDTTGALSGDVNLFSKTSTFVSIDVVDSTTLKAGENEHDIIYTFLGYHNLVAGIAFRHHGAIATISGDGIMCRFDEADDAAAAVHNILQELPEFNKKQNRLSRTFLLRLGINTGHVYESESLTPGQLISHTIDVAAKLQQSSPANEARFSQETVSALKQTRLTFNRLGWNARLKTTSYQFSVAQTARQQERKLPSPVKVLVVEDDLIELMKLKKVLWTRRHDALSVFTAPQAAHCFLNWAPHVILVSLDLPWEAGWELLKGLRADQSASAIPVILTSQQSEGDKIEKCFSLGGNGFLKKPLEDQQVIKRIDGVLKEFYL